MDLKELRRIAQAAYEVNSYESVKEFESEVNFLVVLELLNRLEEAEAVVAFYGDRNNWQLPDLSSDVKEVISMSDLGCKSYTESADFAIPSGGRRARDYFKKYGESK